MSRIFAVLSFFVLIAVSGFSQSLASTKTTSTSSLLGLGADQWSFYHNMEGNSVFIDFETIAVNLNEIQLLNGAGELVLKEPLFDLPVDTIYELDLAGLPAGEYTVELHSFDNSILRRKLKI